MSDANTMYPPVEPFYTDRLEVSPRHSLYVERSGKKGGFPVFFIHGGPGSRSHSSHRRYFDPDSFDIVLFDQRGCGKSTPKGEVTENDTWALVEDINTIRDSLGIAGKVSLFGGSWGSTLSLAYAATYPQAVQEMILRGVFLGTRDEINWFTHGLARFATSAWEKFAASGQDDLVDHYYKGVNSPDQAAARQAAEDWARYEAETMRIGCADPVAHKSLTLAPQEQLLASARVQLHYLKNGCFLQNRPLLESAPAIDVPVSIVQGGLDFICPPLTAWRLSRRLPQARLRLVSDAGHDGLSAKLAAALVEEANGLRDRLRNNP